MRPPYSAASTGARSQLHSSTMTGGYVQQVPYPEGGPQTQHSQLGEDFIMFISHKIHLLSEHALHNYNYPFITRV